MEVLLLLVVVIITVYIFYLVIKSAVKKGIIDAYIEIELSKRNNTKIR